MRWAEMVLVALILLAGVGIILLANPSPAAVPPIDSGGSTGGIGNASPNLPAVPVNIPAAPAAVCASGESRNCTYSGCPGSQTCLSGQWADCRPAPRICLPGQRVSCSTSSCSFGLAQCDACGTGWLDCKPPSDYN